MNELTLLLDRLYSKINNNKAKVNLPKLLVVVENRKTYFSNYSDVSNELNRDPTDLLKYFQAELNTGISINSDNCMVIDGTYREKEVETIVVRYIELYVRCKSCNSLSTTSHKEKRMNYIKCNKCCASSTITK